MFANKSFPEITAVLFIILVQLLAQNVQPDTFSAPETEPEVASDSRNNESSLALIRRGHPSPPRVFFVRVHAIGGSKCGGSLIRANWVLTSANCVFGHLASQVWITVGEVSVFGEERIPAIVSKVVCHPRYRPRYHRNNVALLQLLVEQPPWITLNICYQTPGRCTNLATCGLGLINPDGREDEALYLREIYLEESWRHGVFSWCPAEFVCTRSNTDGRSIMQGDEGGPLYLFSELTGQPQCVYGVANFVTEDSFFGEVYYKSVFSRVSHFRTWITQVIYEV